MGFENLTLDYLAVNQVDLFPTLVHDRATIAESSIINENFDGSFSDISLRPAHARAHSLEPSVLLGRYHRQQQVRGVFVVVINLVQHCLGGTQMPGRVCTA